MLFKAALNLMIYKKIVEIIFIMHPSKVIKDPIINDTYYDPDVDKLYQYVKIGDFPPEWVLTNIDDDDDYYCASMGY